MTMNKPQFNGTFRLIVSVATIIVLVSGAFFTLRARTEALGEKVGRLEAGKANKELVEMQYRGIKEDLKEIKDTLKELKRQRKTVGSAEIINPMILTDSRENLDWYPSPITAEGFTEEKL